jgi:hypothetical protein
MAREEEEEQQRRMASRRAARAWANVMANRTVRRPVGITVTLPKVERKFE